MVDERAGVEMARERKVSVNAQRKVKRVSASAARRKISRWRVTRGTARQMARRG
jgi:hypothetical protein